MSLLRLDLLGPPHAWSDAQPLSFKTRKAFALFAYLAMEARSHPRERLADLLWPEASAADGRHSVRTTLDLLRAALGTAAEAALLRRRETIGLDPSALQVFDVRALAEAQQLGRASPATPRLRAQLEQAVARYRGPFLDTLDLPDAPEFEAWAAQQRARWQGVVGEVCDRLSVLQAGAGDAAEAVGTLVRWTHINPGEEESWRRLIAARGSAGDERRAVEARKHAEAMRQMLAARIADAGLRRSFLEQVP
jgi:DNA-binding SARP family transcriptional activator